jgi:DNA-binding transcriptional LysR family regulator
MELRQLRYFVEIADKGSFTKAAETLLIAQPALTAQIHKLEAEFEAQLFVRGKHGIALTDVGRIAHEQARRTLDAADATMRATQLAAGVASARLSVGFTRVFPFMTIARTVRRIRRDRPDMRLDLRQMWSSDQIDAIVSGSLDIGFVHYTADNEDRDLAIVPIAEVQLVAAIPDGHRLAGRRQIHLSDLADESFVSPAPTDFGETLRDEAFAACRAAGFTPRVVLESSDLHIMLGLVSAGVGVALLSSASRDVRVRGVHYATVVPKIAIHFAAMHRRGVTAKFLKPFLERLQPAAAAE